MTGFSYSKRERENIYKDIVSWNGTKKQLIVAVEKMSELCVEICKYINEDFNPDILSDIAEKTAAVVIMIEQSLSLTGCFCLWMIPLIFI